MKNILLMGVTLTLLGTVATTRSLAIPVVYPVDLELVDPSTGLAGESVISTTGSATFTLNIDVQDPTAATTGTQVLGGFDITLSALPTGLTFEGYSGLISGFVENNSTGLSYSASANGKSNDVTIGTGQTDLLTATFLATATGNYNIDFISQSNTNSQELSDGNGIAFNYTDVANTANVTVAPEPPVSLLVLLGALSLAGLVLWNHVPRLPLLLRAS